MKDIHSKDRIRCITALILCSLIILSVFTGLVLKLTLNNDVTYVGIQGLRYFTIQSNILMSLCATLCIPFTIDGLRNENYHLPRWIMNVLFTGVCTVTMTFLVVATFLVQVQGIDVAFIIGAAPFVHFVTPVLAIVLFIFINDDHRIPKKIILFTLIPVILYGVAYGIEVFGTGNWVDHYFLNHYAPFWVSVIGMIVVYLGIAFFLVTNHNRRHEKHKKEIQEYYLNSEEVSYPTIEEAIEKLAIRNKKFDKGGEVIVPRRIILMMNEKYHSNKNIEELCGIYLKEYLK